MPWVSSHREKLRDPQEGLPYGYGDAADAFLNCSRCMESTSREERADMGCGWLRPEERTGDGWFRIDGAPEASVCPGYTTQLPEVIEAARALSWRQDGQLREFYAGEELTQQLIDCMDLVASEVKRVERHSMREIKRKGQQR